MKKLFFVLFVLAVTIFTANAQEKAIGLRLGGDVEASFQFPVGKNRIELDAGLSLYSYYGGVNFNVSGAYHWVFNIANIEGFNWFVGPGVTVGAWLTGPHYYNSFGAGILAQGGVEYNFKFPLQIAADYRPALMFVVGHEYFDLRPIYHGFALSARYRF